VNASQGPATQRDANSPPEQTANDPAALGYSRDGEVVTIRLTIDDYHGLLMCLGSAAAAPSPIIAGLSLRIANAVNAGRPFSEWRPYEVPEAFAP
jgi:hypothetical protein